MRAPWLRIMAGGVAALFVLAVAGLISLTQAPGRALLTHLLDGRRVDAVGVIRIAGVEGNVLSALRIETLTLSDEEGVWFEAEGLEVDWRAGSLLGDALILERVQASQITVLRRPNLPARTPSAGSGGRGVRLSRLLLPDLVLQEPVLGDRVGLRLDAELVSNRAQGQTLSAEIIRTDGAADRLLASLVRSPDGVIEGEVTAFAQANSPIAGLVYAEGRAVSLEAEIRGDAQSGAADFVFRIDETIGVQGEGLWRDDVWSLQAQTHADAWPTLPPVIRSLLADGRVSGEGEIEARSGRLSFASNAGQVSVERSSDPAIHMSGALNAQGLALVMPASLSAQNVRFEAVLNPQADDGWLEGSVQAEGLSHARAQIQALDARFRLGRLENALSFDVSGQGQSVSAADDRAQALLGDDITFTASGQYDRADRRVRLDSAGITSQGASLEGAGVYVIATREAQGRFELAIADAGQIQTGLSGPVTLRGEGGAEELAFQIEGASLTGEGTPYALATGLSGQGQLAFANGFALSDLEMQGAYLRLSGGLARPQDDPVWRGQIDYALDVEGLGLGGLAGVVAGAASLQSEPDGLSARLQAQADAFAVAGTTLESPVLRVELDPEADGGIRGEWRFDARSQDRDLGLEGAIRWAEGQGRIDMASGRYADIAVQGVASLGTDAVRIDLSAHQDGAIQLWSASLQYEAPRSALASGQLDAQAQLERYRVGGVTINTLDTRLSGPVTGLVMELNAQGATAEAFTLSAGGPVAYAENTLSASLAFEGALGERQLSSPTPLQIAVGQGEASARAALRLGGAALEFEVQRSESGAMLEYDLSSVPADLVMGLLSLPQANGDLALSGRFERGQGAWTGQSVFGVTGLSSASEPGLGALGGEVRLSLLEEGARLTGGLSEAAFELEIDLHRDGAVTGVGAFLEPDWRGDLRLDGDISVLAALYLPEGEVLNGQLSVDAVIDGYDTSGQLRFRDGAYQSAIAGRSFTPISAHGAWQGGALIIDSLQVGEEGKAGARAQAEFRATSDGLEGEGRIDMTQLYLVDRPELSGGATGYAEFTLRQRVLTLTGEAEIERLEVRPSGGGRGSSIAQIEVEELNRPEMLDQAYRRPIRIDLDYRLSADDRLMVSSRAFSSEWSADVHVTGTANRPRLSGQANLLSGQASLLTAPFTLTSGTVAFDGPVNQTRLSIEARHEASDLTVIGRVQGSVRAPEVHFESTPSLPEDEILSRLLFGSGVSDLSPLQASQLAAQLSGAGWLDTMADVRAALGVDRLDVRQNSDGAITVLGGRQLTDDVYLELESGVGQALGAARIEWRLNPSLVLASEVSGGSSNEISLSWRRSFD